MILGEAFHRRNVARIADALAAGGHDALLLTSPSNIAYATGFAFQPSERPVAACVWANGSVALFVPYLEAEAAGDGWATDIRWYPEYPSQPPPLEWMAREAGAGALAFDTLDARLPALVAGVAAEVALVDIVERLRWTKQPEELRLIERAAEFADLTVERLYARLTTGATERDLLASVTTEVDALMRKELGQLYAPLGDAVIGSIVSGPRAALPNGLTTDRRLTRGDFVIADFSVNVGGYHAEAGCTFFMGDPLRETVKLVETTIEAQAAARAALKPGATCASVDAAARGVFAAAGRLADVRHRSGHAVGLERHEAPWLAEDDDTAIAEGMVFSVAPALYLSGRTGSRNVETLVVEEEAARVLNPRSARWRDLGARLKEF